MEGQGQSSSRVRADMVAPCSDAAAPGQSAALFLLGAEGAWHHPDPGGFHNAAAKPGARTPSLLPGAESAGPGRRTRAPEAAVPGAAELRPGVEERLQSQSLEDGQGTQLPRAPAALGTAERAALGTAEQAAKQASHAAGGCGHAPGGSEPEQQNAALPAFASAVNHALHAAIRELEAQVIVAVKAVQSFRAFIKVGANDRNKAL